jgi:ribosomal protein S18 acetylase RimI-like enzyme
VRPEDAALLDRLIGQMVTELSSDGLKSSKPGDFADALNAVPPLLFGVIAERAGEAVGLCLWFPWFSTWRGRRGVYVQDLYVVPAARRSGFARALLREAARRARISGAAFLRLDVDKSNSGGIALYESLGFAMKNETTFDLSDTAFERLAAANARQADEPET